MLSADVVVAGGGAGGLLIASALAPAWSVLLVEQSDNLPRNKYWLTSEDAAHENPHLAHCIDRSYDDLDFIAYDGLTATLAGRACLWDTDKLVNHLAQEIVRGGARILTGCWSESQFPKRTPFDATPFTRVIPLASSGASSPLSAASTASFRIAVIRTLIETAPASGPPAQPAKRLPWPS
jgi:hypothetical protein